MSIRARDAADPRQLPTAVMEQRVDQGPVVVARRGVDNEAGRLVDNDEVIVFERDVERNVLWRGRSGDGLWNRNGEARARGELGRGVGRRLAGECDAPFAE